MADDDNFDIDIYGDDVPEEANMSAQARGGTYGNYDGSVSNDPMETGTPGGQQQDNLNANSASHIKQESIERGASNGSATPQPPQQQISSTGGSAQDQVQPPKQAPIQQGIKRKNEGGDDERPVDPGATAAIRITDLHWWTTEDDIRGWANQSGCEDEVKDVTFNEHKVNGKSKGEVFIELLSAQAATALKHKIESFSIVSSQAKKYSVYYAPPNTNPYRTLPKDTPNRKEFNKNPGSSNFGNQGGSFGRNNYNNRGGFNNRGGGMGNNNFNQGNRNFSGGMNNMGGGYGGAGSNVGFAPQMGMANMGGNFGGGFNRGGMGGMNSNRGGMGHRGRGGMGMSGMNQGMGMGMGMGNMGNMGMMGGMMGTMPGVGMMGNNFGGAGGQGHFNPNFFAGNQGGNPSGGGGDLNPHGAKRARGE